jgi:hypothetical protein
MVKYSLLLNTYYHDQVSKLNESLDENVLTIIYQRNYIQIPIWAQPDVGHTSHSPFMKLS